jgi:hypothetical protein
MWAGRPKRQIDEAAFAEDVREGLNTNQLRTKYCIGWAAADELRKRLAAGDADDGSAEVDGAVDGGGGATLSTISFQVDADKIVAAATDAELAAVVRADAEVRDWAAQAVLQARFTQMESA